MTDVYLCVSIDCECDKGPGWRVANPVAFSGVVEGIARRLQPLFVSHKAKPTYLLSGEILRDGPSVEALRAMTGDAELGTHLHGEFVEPDSFVPEITSTFQRDYPEPVERAKVLTLTALFQKAFARKPQSFRAGRFGIGRSSLRILEDLGYIVDSSVTPFVDWSDKGTDLSFVGAPTQPYHPDVGAPERCGGSPILEVPITIRPRNFLSALPGVGKFVEPRWLRPTWGSEAMLTALAAEEIEAAQRQEPKRPTVLNAMLHNVEVVPGVSPYAPTEESARAILKRLDHLLTFADREGIPVIGLSDVVELL
jgi:hypothetical protein